MEIPLGSFIEKFETGGGVFYCRGLTVGQMTELVKLDILESLGSKFFATVGKECLVAWSDVFQADQDGQLYRLEFSYDNIDMLEINTVVEIGRFVYYELTRISEQEADMFKAYIRFAFARSDKDLKPMMKYFDCKECVKAGRWKSQLCGLTAEERALRSGSGEVKEKREGKVQSSKSRYGASRKRKKRRDKIVEDPKQKTPDLNINGFKFKECPTSWIKPFVLDLGEKMLFCHQNGMNYFNGSLEDQLQKFYEIGRIVTSEASIVESELMEKERKKHK